MPNPILKLFVKQIISMNLTYGQITEFVDRGSDASSPEELKVVLAEASAAEKLNNGSCEYCPAAGGGCGVCATMPPLKAEERVPAGWSFVEPSNI